MCDTRMSDDGTCVSEVTSAISRIRMQSSAAGVSEAAPSSPQSPAGDSPDSPVGNSFRLRDLMPPSAPSTNTSHFKIPIVGYEIMEERARFTVYKLRIENSSTGNCWFVFRRYTDFIRLFSKLKNDFPSIKLTLPRKRWFGDNFDPNFLEDRINGLQCFVNTILEHRQVYTAPSVQDFFCLNEPPTYAESVEESRAVFEALEETIYHLRCQLKERDLELGKVRTCLTAEVKRREKLSQLVRDAAKNCPHCGRDFASVTSPSSDTSTLKEVSPTPQN
ncbi:sorting nexin-16 [Periplaneta americana]|uniref:sorting nexin-16 n=1 Tax=Periplaneta americana TaxID=6978 RepID=UPI0037E7B4C6